MIHVHVPPSAEVHSYKKVIYDRVDDADVKVTSTGQIAQMYIRKQGIYTERKVYPYAELEDLRLDLLPRLRIMAANNSRNQGHPWSSLSDEELIKSAGLYGKDWETGKYGYNLAAIMLLGKDRVISDIVPAYMTDALLRRVNVDRYDDREVIQTNLIESYEQLMEFGRKHLQDKFFLEGDQRKSLRKIITREMIANTLIHREYTSPYQARFVIERNRMYIANANRCTKQGLITPDNLEPQSKNPVIASFSEILVMRSSLVPGFEICLNTAGFIPDRIRNLWKGISLRLLYRWMTTILWIMEMVPMVPIVVALLTPFLQTVFVSRQFRMQQTEEDFSYQPILRKEENAYRFFEPIAKEERLIILGGGHISGYLCEFAAKTGFDVWVVDEREEFSNRERFPHAKKVICGKFTDVLPTLNINKNDYVAIVTRGHSCDADVERFALRTPASYIGVVGSKRKTQYVREKLLAEGFTNEELDRVHAPIGIDIASETPAEIAISIAAQLIQIRAEKAGVRRKNK